MCKGTTEKSHKNRIKNSNTSSFNSVPLIKTITNPCRTMDKEEVEIKIWLIEKRCKELQRWYDGCATAQCRDDIALRMEHLEQELELLRDEQRRIFAKARNGLSY